jgi:spore maturation protein CgeB
MKILYIGQYSNGTTSKMRADCLKKILNPCFFQVINTNEPFFQTGKIWRSIGFRLKKGPLINRTNAFIINTLKANSKIKFDLIWVDKAVLISEETTIYLRSITQQLVHFTPDMAFYFNYSHYFLKSLSYYDYLVTTKTKEIPLYLNHINSNKLIFATQGFDPNNHFPILPNIEKKNEVAFIGLAESSRFIITENLLRAGINVKIAGKGWEQFIKRHRSNKRLSFHSDALFNEEYAKFISSSLFGLGLLSKKFPELHTTRTFEIPACGTALITERNEETQSFFNEDEALFYNTPEEIIEKIRYYQTYPQKLEELTKKGRERIIRDRRDYPSILKNILKKMESNK